MKRKNMLCVQQLVSIPALVEALGYGRDRTFFRAVGQRLVGLSGDIPEPAGRAAEPSTLDAGRLRTSGQLVEQWRVKGAWETIRNAIINVENTNVGSKTGLAPTLAALRVIFPDIGPARSDILICNVVLPFAAAVASIEQDQPLLEQARELYRAYPGLPSNQVTRSMHRQLGLEREPKNACQQQGLHYIYAQTCREKHCVACIVVGRDT
jgi:hypothetical protein